MAAASVDNTELLKGIPIGEWVAISRVRNMVVAHSTDVKYVADKAKKEMGEEIPYIVLNRDPDMMIFV